MYVCICTTGRERERETHTHTHTFMQSKKTSNQNQFNRSRPRQKHEGSAHTCNVTDPAQIGMGHHSYNSPTWQHKRNRREESRLLRERSLRQLLSLSLSLSKSEYRLLTCHGLPSRTTADSCGTTSRRSTGAPLRIPTISRRKGVSVGCGLRLWDVSI